MQTRDARLSDGSSLGDLVSANGRRSVAARVMVDAEIFDLEMERLFGRTWVFVAHETEVPSPGDFVTRQIGDDPVVVTRTPDGEVKVFLNACSHRGTQVCDASRGNTQRFRCPYHGWVFDNEGRLLAAFAERAAFPNGLDKPGLGLKAARVETYRGLVFATWNHDGPALAQHLGDAIFYFDMLFGGSDSGLEVVGPPQRWMVPANWKIAAENFSTDSYHPLTTHRSIVELGLSPDIGGEEDLDGLTAKALAFVTDPTTAHSIALIRIFLENAPRDEAHAALAEMIGLTREQGPQLARNWTEPESEFAAHFLPVVGNIFPNLGWLRIGLVSQIDGPTLPAMTIRVFQPVAPDATEVHSWALVQKDAPDALKDGMRQNVLRSFGTSGLYEQDDVVIWNRIQRGVRGVEGRNSRFIYDSHKEPDPSWLGPCEGRPGFPSEDNQWNFYQRWLSYVGEG